MWMNDSTRLHFMDRINLFGCKSIMANRVELDGSTLHYLAARQAMASVHRPMHSYSLTWQTDRCRMAFKALLNGKAAVSYALLKPFLHLLFENCQNTPTKTRLCVLSVMRLWAHRQSTYTQLSPLYILSIPSVSFM